MRSCVSGWHVRAVFPQRVSPFSAYQGQVDDLFSNRVVPARVVVRRVLLARDQLLRVEQLPVRARPHLVDHRGLEVEHHRPRHVLPGTRLREERVERVVLHPARLVRRHGAVGLDPVLEAVQLPARVADLATGLPDVDGDHLSHCSACCCLWGLLVWGEGWGGRLGCACPAQEPTRTVGRGRHTGDAPTRGLLAATAGARLAGLPSGQKSREDLLRRNSQSGLRARGAQRGRHGSTRQRQEYQLCRGFTWPERLRKIRVRFACHHACASAAAPPSRQRLGTPRLSPGMQGMRLRSRGCAVGDSSLCALVNITASAVLSSPLPPPSCAFSCVDQPALPKNTCVSLSVVRSWIVRMCDHHLDNPSAARISHHFTTRRPTCTAEGCYKRAAQPAPAERTHTHTKTQLRVRASFVRRRHSCIAHRLTPTKIGGDRMLLC